MDECQVRECLLRRAAGQPGIACEETGCTFWRQVGDLAAPMQRTCAIQYFDLLGENGVEVALFLLAMKKVPDEPADHPGLSASDAD
jgi:hypothetical protein